MMPSQNEGIPRPSRDTTRTAWSLGRSLCVAASAARGTVMTMANTVATPTRAAVRGRQGAMTEVTGVR